MGYELVKVIMESDWQDYHSLRRHVLWEARGRTDYDEELSEEYSATNHPLLLKLDGLSIATTGGLHADDQGSGEKFLTLARNAERLGFSGGLHGQP